MVEHKVSFVLPDSDELKLIKKSYTPTPRKKPVCLKKGGKINISYDKVLEIKGRVALDDFFVKNRNCELFEKCESVLDLIDILGVPKRLLHSGSHEGGVYQTITKQTLTKKCRDFIRKK